MMSMLKKIVLFPISLFVAFLALMARWLLTLSSYVVAPLMLYIGATAITEDIGRFSEWLAEL